MAIDDLVVETIYGPVRGVEEAGVKAWKGLRYAAAPAGELRFRAPDRTLTDEETVAARQGAVAAAEAATGAVQRA